MLYHIIFIVCKLCAVTVAVRSACCDLSPDPPQEIRTVFLLMPVLCPQQRVEDAPGPHPSLGISAPCSDYFSELKKSKSVFFYFSFPRFTIVISCVGKQRKPAGFKMQT